VPTITVDRALFFEKLGKEYSQSSARISPPPPPSLSLLSLTLPVLLCSATAFEEFDELLFEYGLELDEDVRLSPSLSLPLRLVPLTSWLLDHLADHNGPLSPRYRAPPAQD
jgi:hypothetical protein